MNQTEYLALLNQSTTFRDFSEGIKATIVNAVGAQRENYIQIFAEEMTLLKMEAEKMVKKNADILAQLEFQTKKALRAPTIKQEKQLASDDMNEAEKLLQKL